MLTARSETGVLQHYFRFHKPVVLTPVFPIHPSAAALGVLAGHLQLVLLKQTSFVEVEVAVS